jgi:thioredoxin 2
MAAPLVDRAARAHAGEIIVLKLNSDQNGTSSAQHGISGIPAFVAFADGREVARQVGLPSAATFGAWVSRVAEMQRV